MIQIKEDERIFFMAMFRHPCDMSSITPLLRELIVLNPTSMWPQCYCILHPQQRVFIPKVALSCATGRPTAVIYSIMFQAFSACVNHIHILDYSNTCTSLLSFCAWEEKLTFADSSLSSSLQASENSTVKCDKMSKNIHRIVKKTETLQVRKKGT